jgi:hypothetical protein
MSAAHQQRMRRRLAASILLVAGAVSACTFPETSENADKLTPPPVTAAAPRRAPPPTSSLPRPIRKPTPPGAPSEDALSRNAPVVDPAHVIGLKEADAQEWLGEPTERKDAPPATIWRYVGQSCEIDVYFYLDLQQRIMRALHYEVRGNDSGGEQRPERCFQQLVSERRERDGGAVADPAR